MEARIGGGERLARRDRLGVHVEGVQRARRRERRQDAARVAAAPKRRVDVRAARLGADDLAHHLGEHRRRVRPRRRLGRTPVCCCVADVMLSRRPPKDAPSHESASDSAASVANVIQPTPLHNPEPSRSSRGAPTISPASAKKSLSDSSVASLGRYSRKISKPSTWPDALFARPAARAAAAAAAAAALKPLPKPVPRLPGGAVGPRGIVAIARRRDGHGDAISRRGRRARATISTRGDVGEGLKMLTLSLAVTGLATAYRGSAAAAIRAPTLAPATPVQPATLRAAVRMAATRRRRCSSPSEPMLSGLAGQALRVEASDIPSKSEVRRVVPDHCFKRDTLRSLGHVAQSAVCTALCAATGLLIPLKAAFLPLWIAYAAVTGTVAMGLWVLAHECGHGAFSDNRLLQDAVGFALHTSLLVPYSRGSARTRCTTSTRTTSTRARRTCRR